ncbi:MAG: hypothetical protein M3Z75_26215 [Actinomycetota bacterium]|nr:hypothetical protein [Actinomycetota bacterium]
MIVAGLSGRAYDRAVPPHPASSAELQRQQARIDAFFRGGWIADSPERPAGQSQQRLPFINGAGDAEVVITGYSARRCVAVLFNSQDFPGARFSHRFTPGDEHAAVWLKEEIETGALRRMMRARRNA